MSCTVRLWSAHDLEAVRTRKDMKLVTILMNATTLDAEMMKVYPYDCRLSFVARFDGQDEPVKFYAPSPHWANWFLSQEYTEPPMELEQVYTEVNPVKIDTSLWPS